MSDDLEFERVRAGELPSAFAPPDNLATETDEAKARRLLATFRWWITTKPNAGIPFSLDGVNVVAFTEAGWTLFLNQVVAFVTADRDPESELT